MLTELIIRRFVLIDQLQMKFDPKFNVITGETGAGKSIILGALDLLCGSRSDVKVLRYRDQKAVIEAHFTVESSMKTIFDELDLDYDELTIVRREISPSGKSRSFINDTPASLKTLKLISARMLNIHQQHDTMRVTDSRFQLEVIDQFGGLKNQIEKFSVAYNAYQNLKKSHRQTVQKLEELNRDQQLNSFLLEELDSMMITEDDYHLEDDLGVLERSEELKSNIQRLKYDFFESDPSFLDKISEASHSFEAFDLKEQSIENIQQILSQLVLQMDELRSCSDNFDNILDVDEKQLQELRTRYDELIRLSRKHKVNTIRELSEVHETLKQSFHGFDEMTRNIESLVGEMNKVSKKMAELGAEISKKRMESGTLLSQRWQNSVCELAMPHTRIKLMHEKRDIPDQSGFDNFEYHVAINKGSAFHPIKDVASGGELSRLALSLSSVVASVMEMNTLVFDEIDTGVSGEISSRMGKLLRDISKHRQVICITHSPQIAALGDMHWNVFKQDHIENTETQIEMLDSEARVSEIAAMLSGSRTSEAAIENARVLLAEREH